MDFDILHTRVKTRKERTFLESFESIRYKGGHSNKCDDPPVEYKLIFQSLEPRRCYIALILAFYMNQ
jgi:hypothetical protein